MHVYTVQYGLAGAATQATFESESVVIHIESGPGKVTHLRMLMSSILHASG